MYQYAQQIRTTRTITQDNITYLINFEEKSADIISTNIIKGFIVTIPHSIKCESTYYVVKRILQGSFENSPVKSIQFARDSQVIYIDQESFTNSEIESIILPTSLIAIERRAFSCCKNLKVIKIPLDSNLRSIGNNAFRESKIESLYIPEYLDTLNVQWCSGLYELQKVKVNPRNQFFCSLDDDMLIKKSYQTQEYDNLIFCNRYIESVIIPSFIRYIDHLAFNSCKRLQSITFQEDSQLTIIHDDAFLLSSIQSIKIPKNLEIICDNAFSNCSELETFEIPIDSKLTTIGNNALYKTQIETLFIPEHAINLDYCWCASTEYLREVVVHPNNKRFIKYNDELIIGKSSMSDQFYDSIIFCSRDVIEIEIPSFIERIETNAFENCTFFQKIIFPKDSKLKFINDFAFNSSTLARFKFPPHLVQLNPFAFNECVELQIVEFPKNSKLKIIGGNAFSESGIVSFSIPSSVEFMETNTFDNCNDLQIIELEENSMLTWLNDYTFGQCDPIIMIPASLSDLVLKSVGDCPYKYNVIFPNLYETVPQRVQF